MNKMPREMYKINEVPREEEKNIQIARDMQNVEPALQKHERIVEEIIHVESIKDHLNDLINRINKTSVGDRAKSIMIDPDIPLGDFLNHSADVLHTNINEIHDLITEIELILF